MSDSESGSDIEGELSLFSSSTSRGNGKVKAKQIDAESDTISTLQEGKSNNRSDDSSSDIIDQETHENATFRDMKLAPWLVRSCSELGITKPTPVQSSCIPKILAGRDVLGCAQTGSGKTAAFALPILHKLAEDPYGPFALILTPSRELAFQIADQFNAFGAPIGVRVTVVVGGMDMVAQNAALSEMPHIIVATPGRLAHTLTTSAQAPNLRRLQYLVLDEADRLLEVSFAPDLAVILEKVPRKRSTLLFSATLTPNLEDLEQLVGTKPFRFDATPAPTTVSQLRQHFVFIPQTVKMAYLHVLLDMVGPKGLSDDDSGDERKRDGNKLRKKHSKHNKGKLDKLDATTGTEGAGAGTIDAEDEIPRADAAIIFVGTCQNCQLICETLLELGVLCAPLHSLMNQRRRLAALAKFKSGMVNVLVATDVASRGLDIPDVGLVLNFDIPRAPQDYIHRVGRTARAGRGGCAISLITQYDIKLIHSIEGEIGTKLTEMPGLDEEVVVSLLQKVSTAQRVAKMRLLEQGFEDLADVARKRKQRSRAAQAAFIEPVNSFKRPQKQSKKTSR